MKEENGKEKKCSRFLGAYSWFKFTAWIPTLNKKVEKKPIWKYPCAFAVPFRD